MIISLKMAQPKSFLKIKMRNRKIFTPFNRKRLKNEMLGPSGPHIIHKSEKFRLAKGLTFQASEVVYRYDIIHSRHSRGRELDYKIR